MILYGFHPVREALRRRSQDLARVLVGRSRGGGRRREIENLCRERGVDLRVVEDHQLGGDEAVHNGFAAELRAERRPGPAGGVGTEAATAGGVIHALRADVARDEDLVVLVEDVQDPRNLGALLRVCDGAGVGRVLVRDRGSAPLSPTAIKASAGAATAVPVERIGNSSTALLDLKQDGFWVYGADAAGDPPWALDLRGKVVLCLGGEEKGLRPLTRERCDRLVGLPMRGSVSSLNLATAAAALLYEAVRQRG